MSTSGRLTQSDQIKSFLDDGSYQPSGEALTNLLTRHNKTAIQNEVTLPSRHFWCLLRFRGEGDLHSIQFSSDHEQDSEDDLVQLFTSDDKYDFQIAVVSLENTMPLTAKTINAVQTVWNIPLLTWAAFLESGLVTTSSKILRDSRFPSFRQLIPERRVISVDGCYLYVPDADLGKHKTAILLGSHCWFKMRDTTWSIESDFTRKHRGDPKTSKDEHNLRNGDRGMTIWLTDQAYRRKCTSEKDFVFLCADALLRAPVTNIVNEIAWLHILDVGLGSIDDWYRQIQLLDACKDVLQILPSWIDNHCLEEHVDHNQSIRNMVLQNYRYQIDSEERALAVIKHKIDLAFARTNEKTAQESIKETRFSKILTVVAIIYLPVSITTSIFGMNIQELNGQGVKITWFIATIFITLGGVLLCWMVFAILTSEREAVKRDWLRSADSVPDDEIRPRNWIQRLWFIDMTRGRIYDWRWRLYDWLVFAIRDLRALAGRSLNLRRTRQEQESVGL